MEEVIKMPATSGSYSFNSIRGELIIRKAYELIGMPLSMVTAEQFNSALNIINFILSDWTNSNVNLWTLKLNPIFLTPGQTSYLLPSNIVKVFQVFLRTNVRQNFGGTAITTQGGVAAYAFDGNPDTACIQIEPNGSIGYAYPNPCIIKILGVQSNVDREYSLTFSGQSSDHQKTYYSKELPKTLYKKGITQWFLLDDNLSSCPYYQIEEKGGAILNITELYFNNQIQDTPMSEVSRYEYFSYPNKSQIGRPTIYYVDYQRTPSLYIWQTAASMFNLLMYSGQSSIETLENYTQSIDIPSYFYMPLIYGLASMLAEQYAPEKAESLRIRYQEALNSAVINNTVEVPFTLEVYSD
jgi:hypothetical protein